MKADFCSDSAINGKCINWTKKLITEKKICKKVPETKSIDFVGFNESKNILLFIEVKSFRGYGDRTNIQRLTGENDDITVEVAQKVRDSLAAIIGGARHSTNLPDKWKKYIDHLNKEKN